ncbi:helix-turn-helix domain-containing protein [Streptomyces sp. NPDC002643]
MTPDDWGSQLTTRVAEQIRRHRKAAGLTVAEAADACSARGLSVPKTTITNLETGRRSSVDLAEFIVLADVLGVPPIALLFPLDTAPTVDVLPGQPVPTWDALAWFTGETASPEAAPKGSPRELLDVFRAHSDAVSAARASMALAKDRRRMANTTLNPNRRKELLEAATGYEQFAFDDARALREFRNTMRERGLVPPQLPTELAYIEQPESGDRDDA